MLSAYSVSRVFVARHKVDFRKRHDGLLAEAYGLGVNPFKGDAVLFVGRDKRRIQILYSDVNGLWVAYKRFNKESLKSKFVFVDDPECDEITMSDLAMLLEGSSYTVHKRMDEWPRKT